MPRNNTNHDARWVVGQSDLRLDFEDRDKNAVSESCAFTIDKLYKKSFTKALQSLARHERLIDKREVKHSHAL